MLKFIKDNKEFTVIFLVAAIIRFIPAFDYQYSYDELCGLRNSIYTNWHDLIEYGVKLDTHPILVQLIINAVVVTFGYDEFWVKLPFLLFSLGGIIYAYLFSLKWYGKTPALITASIFSFSYIFLFYAPLARMYSGGLFFCTALTYYLFELSFSEKQKRMHYVFFVIFILLAAFNNHLSCLYAFTCGVAGLFFVNLKNYTKYISACICAILFYLPHWEITMAQFAQGGIGHSQDGWLAAPDKWAILGFLKTLFGTGYVWLFFVLLFSVAFVMTKEFKVNKKTVMLLILFFVNYTLIYTYSVTKAPIFQYSVMLFSAPCFIWAVTGIIKFNSKQTLLVTVVVSAALIYQSVVGKHFFTNAVLNQNGFQSKEYCDLEVKYGVGKVESYYMASQKYFVINYELKYKRKFNYHIGEEFKDIASFKAQVKNSKADYVLLGEPTQSQLEIMLEYFPFIHEHWQTLNVNSYLLSKKEARPNRVGEGNPDYISSEKFEFNFNKEKLSGESYRVDSLDEFCYSATTELKKLNLKEGNVILAKVKLKSTEPLNDVGFNFSVSNQKDSTLFFGGTDIGQFYTSDSTGHYAYSEIFIGSELKNWLRQDAKITFFIWNRSKKKFTLSDFEIKVIEYWPARWSWWN
ncbi:MAG: glycosyltransferase family 39 protein [Bacteroidia bacterium]|nr:glycosyltransferase family 39 protein [Bacteroidia bacterium]